MTAHKWRTGLLTQARDADREVPVLVMVGLLNTPAGGVQLALRVGDHPPVILSLQDARQLAANLTNTITERLTITAERLGEDDQERGP